MAAARGLDERIVSDAILHLHSVAGCPVTRPLALLPHEAQALAAGRLAQVWRPIKPQPDALGTLEGEILPYWHVGGFRTRPTATNPIACPLGRPGDELKHEGGTLEVLAVRAVRLDEATGEDARLWVGSDVALPSWAPSLNVSTAACLWDAHFGKRYPYAARPWAWAVEVRAK